MKKKELEELNEAARILEERLEKAARSAAKAHKALKDMKEVFDSLLASIEFANAYIIKDKKKK